MKQFLQYGAIVVFSIFVGSQITEGVLLIPYWQSLSATDFYSYYNEFGPAISQFYTVLTIIAALIPIVLCFYYKLRGSNGFKYALISSFFALLFVASFYVYFKEANQLFYQSAFDKIELAKELVIWSYWHWTRIFVECASLVFLVVALVKNRN